MLTINPFLQRITVKAFMEYLKETRNTECLSTDFTDQYVLSDLHLVSFTPEIPTAYLSLDADHTDDTNQRKSKENPNFCVSHVFVSCRSSLSTYLGICCAPINLLFTVHRDI